MRTNIMAKTQLKTLKISECIKVLEQFKKELGDMPIILWSDPEGNSMGTLSKDSIEWDKTKLGNTLFLFPFNEGIEYELL